MPGSIFGHQSSKRQGSCTGNRANLSIAAAYPKETTVSDPIEAAAREEILATANEIHARWKRRPLGAVPSGMELAAEKLARLVDEHFAHADGGKLNRFDECCANMSGFVDDILDHFDAEGQIKGGGQWRLRKIYEHAKEADAEFKSLVAFITDKASPPASPASPAVEAAEHPPH